MEVAERGWMGVQVDQARAAGGLAHREPGLLLGLAQGCLPRRLTLVYVPPWLDPDAEALVQVEDGAPRPPHDPRPGHVDRVSVAVEGVG